MILAFNIIGLSGLAVSLAAIVASWHEVDLIDWLAGRYHRSHGDSGETKAQA